MTECINVETVAVAMLRENFEQLKARFPFAETVPAVTTRDNSASEARSA